MKLASAKDGEDGDLVSIFSHHPFSATEPSSEPLEALPMLMQKILLKIQRSNQPAFTRIQSQLIQIDEFMKMYMENIWGPKKILPREFQDTMRDARLFQEMASIQDGDLTGQDLWLTLHLVWGRLLDYQYVGVVNNMKDPKKVVPEEFWKGIQLEVGPFPSRVAELIKALSGTNLPSFQELLKIFCGGSLLQACSVCNIKMTVVAVCGEVKGRFLHTPALALWPYMPPLFHCGATTCDEELTAKRKAFDRWSAGLAATYEKLRPNKCDNCFKMTDEVHRCSICLTKNYCSKDCQAKDWSKKHQKLCQKGAEEWKVKGGTEARVEAGLKQMEDGFQRNLKLNASEQEMRNMLVEVKEVCEKRAPTVKTWRLGGKKSNGGGKKSDDGEKKSYGAGKKSNGGGKV